MAETETPGATETETPTPETSTETPAGTEDVEKWKALSRQNERAAKAARDELEKLRTASMSEQEKAVEKAKAEGRSEALQAANDRLVRAEVKAAAAGKFANPSDAIALLGDLSQFIDKDGDVDTKAIASAIDSKLKESPYLRAGAGNGSGEGGPRGGSATATGSARIDQQIRRSAGF